MTHSSVGYENGAREREALHRNVMAWALRNSDTPEHVHIGRVQPNENGLKCKCLCIGCGHPVLAVNADKGAAHFHRPGSKQKHFKHQNVAFDNGQCNQNVARKVALRLYVDQDMVELPCVSSRRPHTLPNGETVHIQVQGEVEIMRVVERVWDGDLNVTIIGEDGRECLITVHSQHSVDEQANSNCVLSLHNVIDPSLANLTSEQILALLNDPLRGPRWLRHRDDHQMDALSEEEIKRQEAAFNGEIPEELLQGLTGKQKGETILHWLIKRAVSSLGQLRVPRHTVPVVMTMPDGTKETRDAVCPSGVLILQDVRMEKRLGSMVPDVVCRARMWDTNYPPVDLLIEAAVTHYIGPEKRQKILDSGLACLEIRADRFQEVGRVHASQIEKLVGTDESLKDWIFHPWMNRHIQTAKDYLQGRATTIANAMRERERTAEARQQAQKSYQQWISKASNPQLVKGYLKVLRAMWEGKPRQWMGPIEVAAEDLWSALASRGLVSGFGGYLEVKDCLLHVLLRIDQAESDDELDVLVDRFSRAVMSRFIDGGDVVLLMFALDGKKALMSSDCQERYEKQRRLLSVDIESGHEYLSRNTRLDGLLSLIFPGMRKILETGFATKRHLGEIRVAVAEAKAKVETKTRIRNARLSLVEKGRVAQKEQRRQSDLAKAISDIVGKLRWGVSISEFPTIGMLTGRYRAKFVDTDMFEVFKAAREGVACHEKVELALRRVGFTNSADVAAAVDLLQQARICVDRSL